jgi:hypothetical protein
MTNIESWFIPIESLKIIFTLLGIILALFFLFIIIFDKTCHTIPMMLITNSCFVQLVYSCNLFGMALFTLHNDLKQIYFYNSYCICQGYILYMATGIQMYSYFLQALYWYITTLYPTRLFFQSARFQGFLIFLTWICGIIYPIPVAFTGQITYNVDNQICQMPIHLSFLIIFNASYLYFIPLTGIILIYFKVVRYVHEMSTRIILVNTLVRAQRQLRMIRRIIYLVFGLLVLGLPYVVFIFMSFFNSAPKYHFRLAYIFVDGSSPLVLIALFDIAEPLKISVMKRINRQPNRIIPTMT